MSAPPMSRRDSQVRAASLVMSRTRLWRGSEPAAPSMTEGSLNTEAVSVVPCAMLNVSLLEYRLSHWPNGKLVSLLTVEEEA